MKRRFVLMLMAVFLITVSSVQAQQALVTFGGDANYPPFEWIDKGQAVGFNIELEQAISAAAGLEANHRLGDWPDQLQRLKEGDIDVLPMFASEERAEDFLFTKPFYVLDHGIFARLQTDPKFGPALLAGQRVVVEVGSYAFDRLRQSHPEVLSVKAANTAEALHWLSEGRADYAILAITPANQLIRRNALPVELVSPPFWSRPYVFAVHKDRPELADQLTAGLERVIENGEYRQLYSRWGSLSGGAVRGESSPYGEWIVPLLLLAAVISIWARPWRYLRPGRSEGSGKADRSLPGVMSQEGDSELPRLTSFIKQAETRISPEVKAQSALLVVRFENLRELFRLFGFTLCEKILLCFSNRLSDLGATLVGQVDRDTFVVLLQAEHVSAYLEQAKAELGSVDFKVVPVLRAGWVACRTDSGLQETFRQAEAAIDWAVKKGKPELEYHLGMDANNEDAMLITEFRRYLTRDLFCVFQPQLDLGEKKLIGAEVLIRWRHPTMGMIPPNRFIPLLESAGLTQYVTRYVIDQAIRLSAQLRTRGLPCRLSVNVSPKDFSDLNLPALIHAKLAEYGGKYQDLKLELTETSVGEYPELISNALSEMDACGVASSIDDFGTGYSSLSYLSTYPIREVKIDQLFIRDILTNSSHKSIVRSTIALAHELGLTTVAEGVEDQESLVYLETCGCDIAQGYYISRPIEEADLINILISGLELVS